MQESFRKKGNSSIWEKSSINGNFNHQRTGTLVNNEKDKAMNLINASFLKLRKEFRTTATNTICQKIIENQ
jgi:hypothetical protein